MELTCGLAHVINADSNRITYYTSNSASCSGMYRPDHLGTLQHFPCRGRNLADQAGGQGLIWIDWQRTVRRMDGCHMIWEHGPVRHAGRVVHELAECGDSSMPLLSSNGGSWLNTFVRRGVQARAGKRCTVLYCTEIFTIKIFTVKILNNG